MTVGNNFVFKKIKQDVLLTGLFQNESLFKTTHMKMSFICMKMNLKGEHIFVSMTSHQDSLWHRAKGISGNGLFYSCKINSNYELTALKS